MLDLLLRIADSLSVELELGIRIVSGILYSLSLIPDSKFLYSGFH